MKRVILLLTMVGFMISGCKKENTTNEKANLNHPLICNPDQINRDSVVYKKFDSPLVHHTRSDFNSTDSLFLDTIYLDIISDDKTDFSFFYKEIYTKGPFYHKKDSLFKYLHEQDIRVRTVSEIYISSDFYGVELLFPGETIDSLNPTRHDFNWHSEALGEHLFRYTAGTIEPQIIEYYLPFMYKDHNKQRYGWIRFRLSMKENLNTVYYSGSYSYHEYIVKTEILDYAYQKY